MCRVALNQHGLMQPDAVHVLIVLAPYLLLPVAGWLGGRGGYARLLAAAPAALALYFAWLLTRVASTGPVTVTVPWAPRLGLSLSFHLDGLGLLFAVMVTGIGSLIVLYAVDYLHGHPLAARFQVTLFAFMGSMLGVVLSDNVILLFVFWELTGFTSYFLIAFDHERPEARRAALQALLVTGGGGLALLAASVMIWQAGGTTSLSDLRAGGGSLAADPRYAALVLLVLLAAFTKSAQFPFHFWLPNAMAAPTPVSGYLHSATMVKAGVYLVARMTPLLGGTALWSGLVTTVGAVTLLGAAYRSLLETDLKRILAYTTIAALGAMMMMLGVGTGPAVAAALVYLLAHACYKGALFLGAGAVDHQAGTRDVRALSGLRHGMPFTAAAGILAAVSMAGIPPLFGFVAKEQFYGGVAAPGAAALPPALLLGAAVAASAMLGAAGLRAGVSPYMGPAPRPAGIREAPVALWLAPLVLAALGLVVGIVPGLADVPLTLAAASVTGPGAPVHLALWHGVTPALGLSALTLALTLGLYRFRDGVQRHARPRALRTERLYTATLAGVDSLSRRVAPALQDGSLHTYVRVIMATAVVLLLAAYARSGALPPLGWRTPARPHEVGLALLIMLGAVSAARARSAMAAVLSLGSVGYGLALLYVLYGAPDLAATQFAVETLTVVLFVLVFRQLRGFDSGSTRMGRVRDVAIAGLAGGTIALLVLVTASEGINSRLAHWFVREAPAQAHGRNVVNVILVDFRALDTLGEITVLVTVAIGVRALLRIGRSKAG
jgi:multicomponent Na+:H+ antiporter subunit A